MELLSPKMAELLTDYGGIPGFGVLDHVKAIVSTTVNSVSLSFQFRGPSLVRRSSVLKG